MLIIVQGLGNKKDKTMSVDLATARGELEQKKGSLGASMAELGSAQMQLNSAASEDEKNNLKSTIDGLKQKVTIEALDVNEATASLRSAESHEQKEHLKLEEQEFNKEIQEQEKAKAQEDKENSNEIKEPQAKKEKVFSLGGEDFKLSEKTTEKKDPAIIQAALLKQIQEIASKSEIEDKGPKAPMIANRAAETVVANPVDPNFNLGISSSGDAKTEKSPIIKSSAGASSTNT